MPKNLTGGNKAKKGANKENGKSVKNRHLVEDLLDDIYTGEIDITKKDAEILVGKVEKKLGNGRFHVWTGGAADNHIDAAIIGRMTGKGGKVWIDVGNLVVVDRGRPQDGTQPHIIAVFDAKNIQRLKKLKPDLDDRFFTGAVAGEDSGDGFEFDRDEGVAAEEDEDDLPAKAKKAAAGIPKPATEVKVPDDFDIDDI